MERLWSGGRHLEILGGALLVGALVVADVATSRDPLGSRDTGWTVWRHDMDETARGPARPIAWRAWHEAYLAALRSRSWKQMLDLGDIALRLGPGPDSMTSSDARARQSYLAAFFQARDRKDLDGLLRTAEAFAMLGDREIAEVALREAGHVATRAWDPRARELVRAVAGRLAADAPGSGR